MEHRLTQRNASLYKLWERTRSILKNLNEPVIPDEWNEQVYYLSQCGKSTEEALQYLYSKQPSYEAFLDWLLLTGRHDETELPLPGGNLLTEDDWDSWDRDGYIVIKNAVPRVQCTAAQAAIWEYLDADPSIPSSWYRPHEGKSGMMLVFFITLHLIVTAIRQRSGKPMKNSTKE